MIKSILVIFFAVIAFLMFIVAIAKKHQSHNSKSIFYVSVIISAIGGFILYGCSYAELMDNMILAIVFTMLSTLKMFLFSNDFSDIAKDDKVVELTEKDAELILKEKMDCILLLQSIFLIFKIYNSS